jgi:hypothetical protein
MRLTRALSVLPAAVVAAGGIFSLPLFGADVAILRVSVRNDLPVSRTSETVEIAAAKLVALGGGDLSRVHVFEQGSGHEVLAQALDLDGDGSAESLIFQVDMLPSGERTLELRLGEPRVYRKEDFRVYGRFVRERYDDFAWENDRIAHRMYGAALETWQKEPLTSSAVDVWLKRTRKLIVNDWYLLDNYHRDNGDGGDFYSAGKSRGCGGSGLWRDGHLLVSKNFRDSRVLANGPIRLVFELQYPVWESVGVRSETKRITLDAGQNLSRFESRYDVVGTGDLTYAVGIKSFPDATLRVERAGGWMRAWEPVKDGTGEFGCAVVMAPDAIVDVTRGAGNHLLIAKATHGTPVVYYAGAGWTRSGDFGDVAVWDRYVEQWAQRVKSPLRVQVTTP